MDTPPHFGGVPALSNFLNSVLPPLEEVHVGPITEIITALCASMVFALGLGLCVSALRAEAVAAACPQSPRAAVARWLGL